MYQSRSWTDIDTALRRRTVIDNQSVNQSTNQNVIGNQNMMGNQSMNHSIMNQSTSQSVPFSPSQSNQYQGGMYNQSMNQSMNQSSNQSINQLITPKKITSLINTGLSAIKQITTPKSINQSISQSNGLSSFSFRSNVSQSNNTSMFSPTSQSANHSTNQSTFQSQQNVNTVKPDQSINQLINPSSLPPETLSLVKQWRNAQKFKTEKAYHRFVMLGAGSLILFVLIGCWAIYQSIHQSTSPESSIWKSINQSIVMIVLLIAFILGSLSLVGFVRYHAVSPNIQSISHRQRKLLGLPHDPEIAEQELPVKSVNQSTNQSFNQSKLNQSAKKPNVPLFSASKPSINQSIIPQNTPSRSLTNHSLNQSPISRELMTESSQLTSAIAHMERNQSVLSTPPRSINQSTISPNLYGSGSINQTSPYQTSVIGATQSINQSINQPVKFSVEDERSDDESVMLARDLYHRLSVNQSIDQWTRNVRVWMARAIIQPISQELRQSIKQLHTLAYEISVNQSIGLRDEERTILRSSRDNQSINQSTNQSLMIQLLCSKFPQHPVVCRFVDLQRHTRVSNDSDNQSINYVCDRLIDLGSDTVLNSIYDWRGGAKFAGMEWNAGRFPCDAVICMTAFCAFINQSYSHFSSSHFVDRTINSRSHTVNPLRKPIIAIHQTRPHTMPPYYMCMVEDKEWRSEPGKHNLFQVIAVFVWFVKVRQNGRLGGLSIYDKGLKGLADVID